jgi:hypothetical protein
MKRSTAFGTTVFLLANAASAQWSDNFDGYTNRTVLDNVNGWAGWDDDGSMAAIVTDSEALSPPHSAAVGGGLSDAVRLFSGYTTGRWTFTTHVYLPSNLQGTTYFLLNNDYAHGGPYDWAVEIDMDRSAGTAHEAFRDPDGTMAAPLLYDMWMEVRVEFDLDANTADVYFGGSLIGAGPWDAYSGSGILELEAVELYAPHAATVYWDEMSLQPAGDCIGDFDGNNVTDDRDVIAFLSAWRAGEAFSNCDGNGVIDTRDVICFLNAWNVGC